MFGSVITLRQTNATIEFEAMNLNGVANEHITRQLHDYFNLDVDLPALYEGWAKADTRFQAVSELYPGIRMLRQDPWENLLSFICSTNNNIARITQMVNTLCRSYGPFIATVDGVDYHDFPQAAALQHDSLESELRGLSFGYRAKFLACTARAMANLPPDYLISLRQLSYEDVHLALTQFTGVGPKVADCVALMSMDKHDAVPVDTHVRQIAKRDYKVKSGNAEDIKSFFRTLWGPYAGWAHSVLFTADLKSFQTELKRASLGSAAVVESLRIKTEIKTEIIEEVLREELSQPRKRYKRNPSD